MRTLLEGRKWTCTLRALRQWPVGCLAPGPATPSLCLCAFWGPAGSLKCALFMCDEERVSFRHDGFFSFTPGENILLQGLQITFWNLLSCRERPLYQQPPPVSLNADEARNTWLAACTIHRGRTFLGISSLTPLSQVGTVQKAQAGIECWAPRAPIPSDPSQPTTQSPAGRCHL